MALRARGVRSSATNGRCAPRDRRNRVIRDGNLQHREDRLQRLTPGTYTVGLRVTNDTSLTAITTRQVVVQQADRQAGPP